ncbi:MAG: hypothetical protein LBT14_00050 [Treponema sp.]|jgi:hypothetical protein|nr:hypothetical protein [Treponema sp.]
MATVILELSDFLVAQAKERGLLSSKLYEYFIRKGLLHTDVYPPDFPFELRGIVSPKLYGKGQILGDIIGPFYEEWGMKPPEDVQVSVLGEEGAK